MPGQKREARLRARCARHPRLFLRWTQDVDGRDQPGHDELERKRRWRPINCCFLPGDGIGPEVMAEVKRLIDWLGAQGIAHFETEQGLVGGAAYDASQLSITDATMAMAQPPMP